MKSSDSHTFKNDAPLNGAPRLDAPFNVARTFQSASSASDGSIQRAGFEAEGRQLAMSALRCQTIFTAPFLFLIAVYQRIFSPVLHAVAGPAFGCRFYPTCSHYAAEALRTHGVLRGLALAIWRVLRCSPLSAGGLDAVPPAASSARPRFQRLPRCERVA